MSMSRNASPLVYGSTLLIQYVVVIALGWSAYQYFTRGQLVSPLHRDTPVAAPATPAQPVVPAHLTTPVTTLPMAQRVRLGGYVEADKSMVLSARMAGRVAYIGGHEGDRIVSGDVVVSLDQTAAMAQYRGSWAEVSAQMAAAENARVQLYNNFYGPVASPMGGAPYAAMDQATVPMFNFMQGFMNRFMPGVSTAPLLSTAQSGRSYAALSNARAQYESQLANLVGAQSRIDVLDEQLRDHLALAPWDASIIRRYVEVGQDVMPGAVLAEIADLSSLNLKVEVPARLLAHLRIGEPVPVSIGDTNLWAPVKQVYPSTSNQAQTVTVKVELPVDAPVMPGTYAVAWFANNESGSRNGSAPAVPASAIQYRGSLPMVFVSDDSGRVEMRVLRLGDQIGEQVMVLAGITAGEKVVSHPAPALRSGDSLLAHPEPQQN